MYRKTETPLDGSQLIATLGASSLPKQGYVLSSHSPSGPWVIRGGWVDADKIVQETEPVASPYFTSSTSIVTDDNWSDNTGWQIEQSSSWEFNGNYSHGFESFRDPMSDPYISGWFAFAPELETATEWVSITYPHKVVLKKYTVRRALYGRGRPLLNGRCKVLMTAGQLALGPGPMLNHCVPPGGVQMSMWMQCLTHPSILMRTSLTDSSFRKCFGTGPELIMSAFYGFSRLMGPLNLKYHYR